MIVRTRTCVPVCQGVQNTTTERIAHNSRKNRRYFITQIFRRRTIKANEHDHFNKNTHQMYARTGTREKCDAMWRSYVVPGSLLLQSIRLLFSHRSLSLFSLSLSHSVRFDSIRFNSTQRHSLFGCYCCCLLLLLFLNK